MHHGIALAALAIALLSSGVAMGAPRFTGRDRFAAGQARK